MTANAPLVAGKLPADTRVVVAMSGGVDSSAAAALLAEQGYDVVGITLQLYDHGAAVARSKTCCAGQDIHDARRVADKIGVPHYVLDYESRFRTEVIDRFADSYVRGETPIPCVLCNQTVKFRDLLATAQELGADALATGHYVRRFEGEAGPELHTGADSGRDQSYFLFATTRDQLDLLRFPLGGLVKDETRAIARRHGLTVSDKPDSQDICFVPNGDYASLVARLRPDAHRPGDIVDGSGTVLGRHDGIARFTVGQRRGLGLGGGEIHYVLRLDPENARVVVGPREALARRRIALDKVNWLGEPVPEEGLDCEVKVRSMRPPAPARLNRTDTGWTVDLVEPEYGIAPGQACVFYAGSRVLGGGWIVREAPAQAG